MMAFSPLFPHSQLSSWHDRASDLPESFQSRPGPSKPISISGSNGSDAPSPSLPIPIPNSSSSSMHSMSSSLPVSIPVHISSSLDSQGDSEAVSDDPPSDTEDMSDDSQMSSAFDISYMSDSYSADLMARALNFSRGLQCDCKRCRQFFPRLCRGLKRSQTVRLLNDRSWLELADAKHRYGKNLRVYYKEWGRRDFPGGSFWKWLDENPDLSLSNCPRWQLESETVTYLTKTERQRFQIHIEKGLFWQQCPEGKVLLDTNNTEWIFVLSPSNLLYASQKQVEQSPRFHHTSLLCGGPVVAAGQFSVSAGQLKFLSSHSGHYRPSSQDLLRLLQFLQHRKVDLAPVMVDVQRVVKVARDTIDGGKTSKSCSRYNVDGQHALWFLENQQHVQQAKLLNHIEHYHRDRHSHTHALEDDLEDPLLDLTTLSRSL